MKDKTFSRIYKMLKPEKKSIIVISILAIVINIGEVLKPYLIEIVIDDYLSMRYMAKGCYNNRNHRCDLYWDCTNSEIL